MSLIIFLLDEIPKNPDYAKWGLVLAGCAILVTILIFFYNRSIKVNTTITRVETKVDGINSNVSGLSVNLENFKLVVFDKLLTIKSPIRLTDLGLKIVRESGVAKLVEDYYALISEKVKESKPNNAYRAQQKVLEVVKNLQYNDECRNIVETGAFKTGRSIGEILILGGYYIRDRVLKEIGYDVTEIIEPNSTNKKEKK